MKKTVKVAARKALEQDQAARKALADARVEKTADSFQNFAAMLGMGTSNILSASTYGFNPITRIRTMLEWIHRGSWLGGVAIDVVADDMTREGCEIKGDMDPSDIERVEEAMNFYGVWNAISDNVKWSRLYGGSIGVFLIEGQNVETPLRIETVGKDQFKGVLTLDRWMVEPSLSDLVTEMGPNLGLPKFYYVTAQAPALMGKRIHYSRVFRLEGVRLPYWQRLMENLWGISVIERLYDRMIAFDSGTQGVAQLLHKSYIRTYKIKGLREIIAAGGDALNGLTKQMEFMRLTQTNEGVTLLDGEDEFDISQNNGFGGCHEAILMLGEQISGALQIPLVRLFGQSPVGLNATGESDLRTYYDGISQQQERYLKEPITKLYRCMAQSMGIKIKEGFSINFRPLWQLTEDQKAAVAASLTSTVLSAQSTGLVSDKCALQELKQGSAITGVWSNITAEDIEAANDVAAPKVELGGEESEESEGKEKKSKKGRDARPLHMRLKWHDLDVSIENMAGSVREGVDSSGASYSTMMRNDYGYIRRTEGVDGDHVDCFIGPYKNADYVYVIHTLKAPDFKEYDEDKCMLDFESGRAAHQAFLNNYDRPEFFGSLEAFTVDEFITRVLGTMKTPTPITKGVAL